MLMLLSSVVCRLLLIVYMWWLKMFFCVMMEYVMISIVRRISMNGRLWFVDSW